MFYLLFISIFAMIRLDGNAVLRVHVCVKSYKFLWGSPHSQVQKNLLFLTAINFGQLFFFLKKKALNLKLGSTFWQVRIKEFARTRVCIQQWIIVRGLAVDNDNER